MKDYCHAVFLWVRLYFLRMRLRTKIRDLHALSVQQISDYYLGDYLIGEIRQLQGLIDEKPLQPLPVKLTDPAKND